MSGGGKEGPGWGDRGQLGGWGRGGGSFLAPSHLNNESKSVAAALFCAESERSGSLGVWASGMDLGGVDVALMFLLSLRPLLLEEGGGFPCVHRPGGVIALVPPRVVVVVVE